MDRSVRIVAGTFMLCFWIAWCALSLVYIDTKLGRIAAALERAYPKQAEATNGR